MTKATKAATPSDRLRQIAKRRAKVVRLRSQLDQAKEHVKELKAELRQALEELIVEAEQPSLPFDSEGD